LREDIEDRSRGVSRQYSASVNRLDSASIHAITASNKEFMWFQEESTWRLSSAQPTKQYYLSQLHNFVRLSVCLSVCHNGMCQNC